MPKAQEGQEAVRAVAPSEETAATAGDAQSAAPAAPGAAARPDDRTGTVEAAPAAALPPPAAPATAVRPAGAAPAAESPPTPDPQAAKLIARAETAIQSGDVTSARLWLKRASDSGDSKATFRLAETYDPAVLRDWHVLGLMPDPARARELYRKALDSGETGAQARLEALPQSP